MLIVADASGEVPPEIANMVEIPLMVNHVDMATVAAIQVFVGDSTLPQRLTKPNTVTPLQTNQHHHQGRLQQCALECDGHHRSGDFGEWSIAAHRVSRPWGVVPGEDGVRCSPVHCDHELRDGGHRHV
jgi:hypothetical protein